MEKKFARSTNFITREENILINLVKKFKEQVECKKSDTNTNKIKAEAWKQISKEFNCNVGEPYRTEKVLKNKYENIKKRAKQKFADQKKYITGTGGGPSKDIVITTTESDMHEILGTVLTGMTSEFEGDATAETIIVDIGNTEEENLKFDESKKLEQPCSTPKTLKIENHQTSDDPNISEDKEIHHYNSDWSTYTPDMLKRPLSHPFQTLENKESTLRKKKSCQELGTKLEEWVKGKSTYTSIQEEAFKEKHLLTIEQMKEKHQQDMTIQAEESELRKKYMAEEHALKMKILENEIKSKYLK